MPCSCRSSYSTSQPFDSLPPGACACSPERSYLRSLSLPVQCHARFVPLVRPSIRPSGKSARRHALQPIVLLRCKHTYPSQGRRGTFRPVQSWQRHVTIERARRIPKGNLQHASLDPSEPTRFGKTNTKACISRSRNARASKPSWAMVKFRTCIRPINAPAVAVS